MTCDNCLAKGEIDSIISKYEIQCFGGVKDACNIWSCYCEEEESESEEEECEYCGIKNEILYILKKNNMSDGCIEQAFTNWYCYCGTKPISDKECTCDSDCHCGCTCDCNCGCSCKCLCRCKIKCVCGCDEFCYKNRLKKTHFVDIIM